MDADTALGLIRDGDHIAVGGTLYSRTPTALVFALLRTGRRDLTVSRPLSCYEAELLLATGVTKRLVTSWVGIGLKWGLSPVLRAHVEQGLAEYEEWSHLAIGLRYKAGAMGVPFLPTFTMLGSDLAAARELETVQCPYSGDKLLAVPALQPDIALIHVHCADEFGNARIDGYRHMDPDMARAARTVIVSAERVVTSREMQAEAGSTVLPHFVVDGVVEAPFGAYPSECYGLYEADLDHFEDYIGTQRDNPIAAAQAYVDRNVIAAKDFAGFLDLVGRDRLDRQVQRAGALMSA